MQCDSSLRATRQIELAMHRAMLSHYHRTDHTHYTLSVAIELGHLLLTAARFAPAVRASRRTVRASWLVYQGNSLT